MLQPYPGKCEKKNNRIDENGRVMELAVQREKFMYVAYNRKGKDGYSCRAVLYGEQYGDLSQVMICWVAPTANRNPAFWLTGQNRLREKDTSSYERKRN